MTSTVCAPTADSGRPRSRRWLPRSRMPRLRPLAYWIAERVHEAASGAGRRGSAGVPRPAGARPTAAPGERRRPRRAATPVPGAAAGRVPGHRPDPTGTRGPHRRWARGRRPDLGGRIRACWIAVRRGRSEAVDLPVPAGQHQHLPASGGMVRRHGVADHQLPHGGAAAGLGEPRVLRSDPADTRGSARLSTARPVPPHVRRRPIRHRPRRRTARRRTECRAAARTRGGRRCGRDRRRDGRSLDGVG